MPFSAFLKSLVCLSKASQSSSGVVARETLLTTCDELVPLYPWISAVNTDSMSSAASAFFPFRKAADSCFHGLDYVLKDFGGSVDSETQPWVLQSSSSVLTDPKGESRVVIFVYEGCNSIW